MPSRRLNVLVVALAVLWHLAAVLAPPRIPPPKDSEGRDFASYYYAARVAAEGGDPYDKGSLEAVAQRDGTRTEVHPYFYPPPFLMLVGWSPLVDLRTGFAIWWVMNELSLLATCVVLVRWWRPFGEDEIAPVLAVLVAGWGGVAYSAELGQANFPVLLAVVLGLWLEDLGAGKSAAGGGGRRLSALAGVAVGTAAMWKMSPAFLVFWWLVRQRRIAALSAIGTAVGLTLASLALLPFPYQLEFYRDILPGLSRGAYNGLEIQIGMFANHSVPNVLHQFFPAPGNVLSPMARAGATAFLALSAAGLGLLFRERTNDPVKVAAQACAVLVAALLVPVYTYEHHLVFAVPAALLTLLAVIRGWLPRWTAAPVALAVGLLMIELSTVRAFDTKVVTEAHPRVFFLVQEAKFFALCVLFGTTAWLGNTAWLDRSRPPPPIPA